MATPQTWSSSVKPAAAPRRFPPAAVWIAVVLGLLGVIA